MTEQALRAVPGDRRWPVVGVVCLGVAGALGFGALLPAAPLSALDLLVAVALTVAAPFAAVCTVVAVTVLVPFDLQDQLSLDGGPGHPGLLFVDLVMVLGLGRLGWLAARGRLAWTRPLLVGAAVALVLAAALVRGLGAGAPLSEAGHEARRLVLGVGTFLLAHACLDERSGRRRALGPVLVALGLALGLWGLAQWVFDVGYTSSGDVGVRPGVDVTSSGPGQLQGGLYAYPAAVTTAWAALVSGRPWPTRTRWALGAVLGLNGICLLLTFERAFWVVTVVACAVVALRSGTAGRRSAVRWGAAGAAALAAALAVAAPDALTTAGRRLTSVGQLQSDTSLSSRLVESRAVLDAIREHPLTGSGLGAEITWGGDGVFGVSSTPFSHNGYLWLAWKLGVPAALAVVVLIGAAAWPHADPYGDPLTLGAQASVLAILLVSAVFPAFNALGITAATGLLVAVCTTRDGDRV